MASAERPLVDLAAVVSDGGMPDWAALESSADAGRRRVIGRLRTLGEIARIHQTLTTAGAGTVPVVRMLLEPGTAWGDLQILDVIGSGRFGDVYRAFDPSLDREVALKILATADDDLDDLGIMVEEGRLAAKVRHPNVVTIYGARRIDGWTGVWMELVRGRTLEAELAAAGPFGAEALTRVAVELGGALAAVHGAGLVHRDVKTTNVMRDADGRVVLGDFGTGRAYETDDKARSGLAGTPPYLAPEIFTGQPATPQSDIYSLGVLLYRLATGRFPVSAKSLQGYRAAHQGGAPASVTALRSDLPRRMAAAIDRALSANPSDRFETAAALAEAVQPRKRQWPAIAGAAVAAIALLGAAWWTTRPALSFAARDWVLVTAFDNRTSNPAFGAMLQRALEDELRASRFANVVPRERVNDALLLIGKPLDTPLNTALGRDIAARDGGIRALIAGQVLGAEGDFTVSAQILAPDGSIVASVNASAANFFGVVEQAALEIRRRLGETLPSIGTRQNELPRVSTRSTRALEHYARAMQLFDSLKAAILTREHRKAIEQLLELAIAEDPGFAMAHMRLAMSIGQTLLVGGSRTETTAHATRALELSRGVGDAERLFIIASANLLLGFAATDPQVVARHYQESETAFHDLLRQQPDHVEALTGLADLYRFWNRPAEQMQTYLRIGEVRPNGVGWRMQAARVAYRMDDLDQARPFAHAAAAFMSQTDFEREPFDASWIKLFPAIDAWLQRDPALSLRLLDRAAAELPAAPAGPLAQFVPQIVHMYLTLGRLGQARETIRWLPDRPDLQALKLRLAADVANESGDTAGLRNLLRSRPAEELSGVPGLLLEAGLVDNWRRVQAHLKQARPNEYQLGLLALAEGRTADAVRLLNAVIDKALEPAGLPASLRASAKLSEVQRAAGDTGSAIATLEGASRGPLSRTISGWSVGHYWIRIRAALLGLYRDAGRHSEADAVEQELRHLMAVADADHPVRAQLRRTHSK